MYYCKAEELAVLCVICIVMGAGTLWSRCQSGKLHCNIQKYWYMCALYITLYCNTTIYAYSYITLYGSLMMIRFSGKGENV